MAQLFEIHPQNPQSRLIRRAVEMVRDGALVVYPTDSCYALGCRLDDKSGVERIRRIRRLATGHNFTLVCSDLSEIGTYARADNVAYRLVRAMTPGPYTFILRATREVPRRLQHPRRKTIGIRVPRHPVSAALMEALGEPLMSTSLILPDEEEPRSDAREFEEAIGSQVDLIIDGGYCGVEPTSVIDLSGDRPEVLRRGCGELGVLEE